MLVLALLALVLALLALLLALLALVLVLALALALVWPLRPGFSLACAAVASSEATRGRRLVLPASQAKRSGSV